MTDTPRDETIDALVALGVDERRARRAVEEGSVPLVLVREGLGDDRPYTLGDVADKAGIEVGALSRIFDAIGMTRRDRFGESDLHEARQLAALLEVFSLDALVRLARVRGIAVARIAMGDLNAVRDELVAPLRRGGADDLAIAVRLAESSSGLLPVASDLLQHAYRRALLEVLSSEIVRVATQEAGSEVDLAVGFVDLVGYTALSARIDPHGLDEVLEAFEQRVFGVAGETAAVTLVKFLGDAAMFVAADPAALAEVLLRLLDPIDALEDAPMRAGLAAGPVLVREGDYFGPTVNMAARLTDRARPWRLLADDDLHDVLAEAFEVSRIRPMRIRGVGMRRPVAVRPPAG